MSRPYLPYSPHRTTHAGDRPDTPTDAYRQDDFRHGHNYGGDYDADYGGDYPDDHPDDEPNDDAYADYGDAEEFSGFSDDPIDRRWIWVAGVAGAVLLVAVICTVVILGGGDSGSVSATVSAPTPATSQPATTTAAQPSASAARPPAPATSLAPETVTTVTSSPSASASAPASAAPTPAPAEAAPAPNPRAVTYSVTGNRQLIDLVTIIYTDQQGALQTDINVPLPWTKTVVLDPGVQLSSVTATSVAGQLNCSITDGAGAMVAAQQNNTMIATCTK